MIAGKSLVIQIYEGIEERWDTDESLCSVFFRWGGYSVPALANTATFLNVMKKNTKFRYMPKETETFEIGELKGRITMPNVDIFNFINNANSEMYFYNEPSKREQLLQFVIDCFEKSANCRIIAEEYDYMQECYPNVKFNKGSIVRARGLIAVSEDEQSYLMAESDGIVQIFLREQEVWSDVYEICYDENLLRDFLEDYEGLNSEEIEHIIENMEDLKQDPVAMKYDEIQQRIEQAKKMNESKKWYRYEDKYYRSID